MFIVFWLWLIICIWSILMDRFTLDKKLLSPLISECISKFLDDIDSDSIILDIGFEYHDYWFKNYHIIQNKNLTIYSSDDLLFKYETDIITNKLQNFIFPTPQNPNVDYILLSNDKNIPVLSNYLKKSGKFCIWIMTFKNLFLYIFTIRHFYSLSYFSHWLDQLNLSIYHKKLVHQNTFISTFLILSTFSY